MTSFLPPGSADPLAVPLVGPLEPDGGEDAVARRRPRLWRRFIRDRPAVAGLAFLVLVAVAAVFAPLVAPYSPYAQDLNAINSGPSLAHLFGTDDVGRDILSRIIWGGRISLRAAFETVGFAVVFAVPLGLMAGYFRGWLDAVMMRMMDAMFSFPPLVLALTVAALLGSNINDASLAIGIVFVPSFVRLIRGEVIAVREETFIESSRSVGASSWRQISRHILPNVASPIIIQVSLALGYALLAQAGLSFLGIGNQPPSPSWGSMLQEAYSFIFASPLALVFPGLAIMFTVLSFNLVADGLRDALGRERAKSSPLRRMQRARALRSLRSGLVRNGLVRVSPDGSPIDGARLNGLAPASSGGSISARAVQAQDPALQGVGGPDPLLVAEGLRIEFASGNGWLTVVEGASFSVAEGKTLGLVGESGSGKTVSALAIMGLLPPRSARLAAGAVRFAGRDLTEASPAVLRRVRGGEIAMIFQEPMTSLNPAFTVGSQIAEQVRVHRRLDRSAAKQVAVEMLDRVEIPNAAKRSRDYPHAFSGGMRQRVMIAMALSCSPRLLIADEPTTALDVTTQAQIVDLLLTLQREEKMAMLFVTHDLGVISEVADDVVVMYAGEVVERGGMAAMFEQPGHPYTEALMSSIPQLAPLGSPLVSIPGMVPRPEDFPAGCRFHPRCAYAQPACASSPTPLRVVGPEMLSACARHSDLVLSGVAARPSAAAATAHVDTGLPSVPSARTGADPAPGVANGAAAPVLVVRGLVKHFPIRTGVLRLPSGSVAAVDGVDLDVVAGRTLGLVGESGSGKSTLARVVGRLIEPTAGSIKLDGVDLTALHGRKLQRSRQAVQMIFQDPYSSLDPKHSVGDALAEPLQIHTDLDAVRRRERSVRLLEHVGLGSYALDRRPHELSGGQRQRVAIARAIALEPRLVVCDEPVSALDASTQSQVINLLLQLQADMGLSYLFIAHDLSVVRHISQRIAVMYLGQIVEEGEADDVYLRPAHPYTAALLSAIPRFDSSSRTTSTRVVLRGEVEVPVGAASRGCRFRNRCVFAMDVCTTDPLPYVTPSGTTVRCHLHTSGPRLEGESVLALPMPRSRV